MAERFDYPVVSPTTNFVPAIDPQMSGSGEALDDGIVGDQSAGRTQYRYSEGVILNFIDRAFKNSAADKASFKAFKAAVGGDVFKFTDYTAATHTVSFEPGEIVYTPEEGDYWVWKIRMREEL